MYPDSKLFAAPALEPIESPLPLPVTVFPEFIVTNSLSIRIPLNLSEVSVKSTLLSIVNFPSTNVVLNDFPFVFKAPNLGIAKSPLVNVVKPLFPAQVRSRFLNIPRFTPSFINLTFTLLIP